MCEMLAILLKKEGLEVCTAGSRAEAADLLRAGPVELVLTDVQLPDGDGLEILRHVKAASPETAVVVMTAYGTTEMAVAARKLGAEAYILKPFDVDELRIGVRDALANRKLRQEVVRLKREVGQAYELDGPRHRRQRHRQGAGRAGDPRPVRPRRRAVRQHQLRRPARHPARE